MQPRDETTHDDGEATGPATRDEPRGGGTWLTPAEVEVVLRRAAELGARRRGSDTFVNAVAPEYLVRAATAVGINEHDLRRALYELFSERKTAEPRTIGRRLYGSSRLKAGREVGRPAEPTRAHLEDLLRGEQGLRLRRKTEASSLFDAGDSLGAVRRALDLVGHHSLLKARGVELRVEDTGYGRSGASLTADVANQRAEYLSLGGILGATLAVPLAIAGVYDWLYFLAVPPALATPVYGFKFAYKKVCADARRALDGLLDAAEQGPPKEREMPEGPRELRKPGEIRGLKPIPKFAPQPKEE